VLWKVRLDPGLSSLSVAGGRVLTMVRRLHAGAETEFCVALHADTGAEVWATPLGIADYPNGGVGDDDGPRSTPAIDGDRVYVLTSYLRLAALNAANGQVVWSQDLPAVYGSQLISWQNAASPVVLGDLVLLNGNSPGQCLMAFRKADGQLAWKRHDDRMTQASPVIASFGGVTQVVFFTQSGLISVEPATGRLLWERYLSYSGTSVAASPVVAGDLVYVSRAYPASLTAAEAGAAVTRVTPQGTNFTAANVWFRTNQLMNHWSTPVIVGGHVYGLFGQGSISFRCVNATNGVETWPTSGPGAPATGFGYGSVIAVGGRVLALTERGTLVLVAPNPAAYTEVGRYRALTNTTTKCWNAPAVSNGRIYVRSTLEAVSLDVSVPPLALTAATASDDLFRLTIGTTNGAPVDAGRAARVQVLATADPGAAGTNWVQVTNRSVLTNGQIIVDDPLPAGAGRRFYQTRESP
jgi:outer membrane protein assembly factor BamB